MENTPFDIEQRGIDPLPIHKGRLDTARLDWLGEGGMERLIIKKLGLTSKNPSYEYRIRLNVGSADEPWRYSEPLVDLREAIDFGIANPLIK